MKRQFLRPAERETTSRCEIFGQRIERARKMPDPNDQQETVSLLTARLLLTANLMTFVAFERKSKLVRDVEA